MYRSAGHDPAAFDRGLNHGFDAQLVAVILGGRSDLCRAYGAAFAIDAAQLERPHRSRPAPDRFEWFQESAGRFNGS